MRDAFITTNNFVDYMQEAMNVYVASSFLNRFIVDNIKANLNKLPFKGGRNFKFLLNEDFHSDPMMRRVLINMLLEIPNTEVRIYKGPKVFHAKVYLFESGNNMFAAIGSFNATFGGAGGNIEAGVRTGNREVCRQAKEFFKEYWDSEHTEKAVYDPSAICVERKFKAGDPVIVISTSKHGVILNIDPVLNAGEWEYRVFIDNRTDSIKESNLTLVDLAWYGNEANFNISDIGISINDWIKNYILEKALGLNDKTLASYASSRTEVYHYQFRPLLKILHSSEHRLLIADEVGLGKTIEAGIILKEFMSRLNMKRILVIVPNSLKTKWKDELRIRFDEYYDIITTSNIGSFLNDYTRSPEGAVIKGIITYDQLVGRSIREKLDKISEAPNFDMIIIDEAHHLKNAETIRHKVIKKLTKNTRALILLTATPIQLHTVDLHNLLSILLPKYSEDALGFSAKLSLNEKIMQAIKYLSENNLSSFQNAINEIKSRVEFRRMLEGFENAPALLEECLGVNQSMAELEKRAIGRKLYDLNVLNRYVSRTLRKDVALSFPDRVVETQEYEYTIQEKRLYDAILANCRKHYAGTRTQLSFVVFERQAASSLIAMAKAQKYLKFTEQVDEYEDSLEIIQGEEEQDIAGISQKQYSDVVDQLKTVPMPTTDSKLDKLKSIINGISTICTNDADKKVLIFCTFIATIHYLKEELKKTFPSMHIDTLTGADEISERDGKRKTFKNQSPSILICSEVAGEGLDFQFCHYLINYDMPWNPSKLEQRVGRIDRIGQKAEKITIMNLVNKYTIEDYIMAKLFERIKLFNSTIGPLGEVLGHYQKEFSVSVLKQDRTDKEKEEYEKRILANIENKKKEQDVFERNQVELFCVLDYFYEESKAKTSYFRENEILLIWNRFIQEKEVEVGKKLEISSADAIYKLVVDDTSRIILLELLENGLDGIFNRKKRDHYRALINSSHETNTPISYTADHRQALENLSLEFLSITHPFILGALQYLKRNYVANKSIVFCKTNKSRLPKGSYIIFIYRFEVLNTENPDRQFIEEKVFLYNIDSKSGKWESPDIISEMLNNCQESAPQKSVLNLVKEICGYLETETKKMGQNVLEEYRRICNADLDKKKESLIQHYNARIGSIRQSLQVRHDPYQRKKLSEEIDILESEKKQKLSLLVTSQLKAAIRCGGIAMLNQEGVES